MATWWEEVLSDSPKLVLKMDEASGNLTDSSGFGHTATVTGSPTYQVAGPAAGIEYGITIATGSYFTVADHADLDLGNGPFTIEFWYKRGSTSDNGAILGKADGTATAGYIVSQSATDFLRLEDGSTSSHVFNALAATTDTTNWLYAVFTRANATNAKLYINATDVTDIGGAKTFTDNNQALLIGRGYSTGGSYDGVTIASPVIYKSELSSARIAAHYAARDTVGGGGGTTVKRGLLLGIG